eukprot:6415006-Amphidinium_carterae.1
MEAPAHLSCTLCSVSGVSKRDALGCRDECSINSAAARGSFREVWPAVRRKPAPLPAESCISRPEWDQYMQEVFAATPTAKPVTPAESAVTPLPACTADEIREDFGRLRQLKAHPKWTLPVEVWQLLPTSARDSCANKVLVELWNTLRARGMMIPTWAHSQVFTVNKGNGCGAYGNGS